MKNGIVRRLQDRKKNISGEPNTYQHEIISDKRTRQNNKYPANITASVGRNTRVNEEDQKLITICLLKSRAYRKRVRRFAVHKTKTETSPDIDSLFRHPYSAEKGVARCL